MPKSKKASKNSSNIDASKDMVGKIYANWCGHCRHLEPEWNKLEQEMQGSTILVVAAESEETDKLNQLKALGIMDRGYPTIFKRIGGKVEYYGGKRLAKDIGDWAKKPVKMPVMGGKRNTHKVRTIRRKRNLRNTIRRWLF